MCVHVCMYAWVSVCIHNVHNAYIACMYVCIFVYVLWMNEYIWKDYMYLLKTSYYVASKFILTQFNLYNNQKNFYIRSYVLVLIWLLVIQEEARLHNLVKLTQPTELPALKQPERWLRVCTYMSVCIHT